MKCIVFSIEQQNFAFDLSYVSKVIQAVAITALPKAPLYIMGAINMHGLVIPVMSLRALFNMAERELELSDQFIICQFKHKPVALWVDHVDGITDYASQALIPAQEVFPDLSAVDFVVKEKESFILVYNFEQLLPEEF